jgi:hypothetical protein
MTGILLVLLIVAGSTTQGAEETFEPLFNGRDLSGWVPVNLPTDTFTVRDGIIVSTGKPTGVMRTDRMYENFVLELEWKHLHPKGNAGLFIWSDPMTAPGTPFARAIEVQILDPEAGHPDGIATGHGDLFAIHGAHMTPDRPHPGGWERCLPSEHRVNPAGEWNHYRVEARDGRITLSVNGKVVSGGDECTPRKGYICLESEGSECHFRNLRIRELPSSNPPKEHTANTARDWRLLYNGLDLDGWEHSEGWKVNDWILEVTAEQSEHLIRNLELDDNRPCEILIDWKPIGKVEGVVLKVGFNGLPDVPLKSSAAPVGRNGWNRTTITYRDNQRVVIHNDNEVIRVPLVFEDLSFIPDKLALEVTRGSVQFANIFVRQF